jgi:6-pyruvoyltetrahydropterin/6-carboxytetrahydropterin synthase
MFEIRVEDHFAAAHFLSDYHGKCERLHGHNYRVRAWARGDKLKTGGMLLDFAVFKKALGEITGELDHRHLNEHPFFADGSPSAERLAFYIFNEVKKRNPDIPLHRIDVFETEKNMASWINPD